MRTLLINEIHDDLMADSPEDELQDYLGKVSEVMTVDIKKHWSWLIAPMTIEHSSSLPGSSWWDKKKMELKKGIWQHKEAA
jgi:hypothetical protein